TVRYCGATPFRGPLRVPVAVLVFIRLRVRRTGPGLSQGSWCVTPKQSNECVHLPGRLHGTSCLEEPSCRPRPGQVQRLDNLHGLDWDGPGLSQEVNGLKVGALSQRGFLEGRSFRHDLAGSGPGPIPTEAMMRFYQQAHAF